MYQEEQLITFNEMLLQRGAPVTKDDIGYNKPDYSICHNYYYGLSDAQLADLSTRLIKYCNIQLNIDIGQMKETANYLSGKIANESIDNSVSVQIGKEMTLISFTYNCDYISVVKTANRRKYDPELRKWYVANNEVLNILERLQKVGANCTNAIEYVKSKIIITEQKDEEIELQKICAKLIKDKIIISFDYNAKVVDVIKFLNYRKYDPTNRAWTIKQDELNIIINNLKKIDNLDLTELIALQKENDQQIIEEVKEEEITINIEGIKRKPFEHQITAAKFLIEKKKAILADEMGGGKTLSSIIASNNIEGKTLVVCPASLKINWQKEIKLVSDEQIKIINGKGWIKSNKWTIINYDILNKHIEEIAKSNFKVVIFDESHYGKAVTNSGKPNSCRADMMVKISQNIDYVFLLTGTPITNKTKDIFNTLKCVNHYLSKNFFAFGKKYCDAKYNGYGWDFNGSSNQSDLNEKLKPYMLRRLKSELLDLPEKIRSFIPVQVNLKDYEQKLNEYMTERENLNTQGEHLVYLNAMRHILAKEKVNSTIEQIENLLDQDQQVVVFTCYNFVVNQILQKFNNIAVKLTGDCNIKQRQKAVDDFQSGNKKVIVCNIIAGGVGITLTASQTVIFNDFDWVPANHAQAEDRIHRIGQMEKCNIIYMYANKARSDEMMAEVLERKLNNISKIIDGKEESFLNELIDLI